MVALALLSACGLPSVDPIAIPADVAAFIPPDIDMSEVNRDTNGCYFYTYGASLFTVNDDSGAPICLPDLSA
ncbi:hypothetical protein [Yoonia sp. I 8.24]|uniref:hypothetical protein n=1 Tax=Yoonia sp. I 8.24 TaxID=1537229 RepID=UPI001EDD7CAA|nr:hypothetical protein [Yoonia sp. I 8.24]MCG3269057.1 hypothetical protein [Yoonia sp. I 8.24]